MNISNGVPMRVFFFEVRGKGMTFSKYIINMNLWVFIHMMLRSIASFFWVLKFPSLWPRKVLHIDFMLSFWYDPFALISSLLSGTRYHRLTMNFLPWLEETLLVYILVPFFPNSCSFLKGRKGRNRERWVQRRREWQWQIANTVGDSLLFLGLCLLVDEITLLQGPCLYASLWLCLWDLLSLCPLSIFVPSQVLCDKQHKWGGRWCILVISVPLGIGLERIPMDPLQMAGQ